MDFDMLTRRLSSLKEFQNLEEWTISPVVKGETSPHTYRFQYAGKDYFIKEITDKEQNALRLLHAHQLQIAPRLIHPGLLDHGILVSAFIPGERLTGKKLADSLLVDYASMQNTLNSRAVLSQPNPFNHCKYNDRDDGTFRKSITENDAEWERNLAKVREYGLSIVYAYDRLASYLKAHKYGIADVFSEMPFGWLHNDLREENIIGDPMRVVDWGSSFGHGPFLWDLAPFLLMDENGFETFIKHSCNCQPVNRPALKRWLYAAGWGRFLEFMRWQMQEGRFWQTREECETYLTYEYQSWKALEEEM